MTPATPSDASDLQGAIAKRPIDQDVVEDIQRVAKTGRALLDESSTVIVGKSKVIRLVLVNLLSRGNLLFEDVPGTAKSLLCETFARASGCDFNRVQFTPDVLPADITGSMVYNQDAGEFTFRRGPVFTNFLLADEINRAPPKTQSALLETMQERQVSVEGTTHSLDEPYIVMATQNPVEQEGTYPLPEAQMDRFLMKLEMGYPSPPEEEEIGRRRIERQKDEFDVEQVARPEVIVAMQDALERMHFDDAILEYITDLVVATRGHADLKLGASPRGTLGLIKASRGWAALEGRPYVTPDDVREVAVPVLAHRIIIDPEAQFEGTTCEEVVRDIVESTSAPTV